MHMKLIAIGNRLMGDDGAAIAVAEAMSKELAEQEIQVIIGETDAEYSLSFISEKDIVIILDASISGGEPGDVRRLTIEEILETSDAGSSQHDADLFCLMKQWKIKPQGLLICIEASAIQLSWGLSDELQKKLPGICDEIKWIIAEYKGSWENA